VLVAALHDRVKYASPWDAPRGPATKPHGRLGWTISLDGGAYIDLSVMPPRANLRDELAGAPIPNPEDTP
jgi:hypothetical protein